jgi:hypothetical protein
MRVVDDFHLSEGANGNGNYPAGSELGTALPADGNGAIANSDTLNNHEVSR